MLRFVVINIMNLKFLFLIFLVPISIVSQNPIQKEEMKLDSILKLMRSTSSFDEKMKFNNEFKRNFKIVLERPDAFFYPFVFA